MTKFEIGDRARVANNNQNGHYLSVGDIVEIVGYVCDDCWEVEREYDRFTQQLTSDEMEPLEDLRVVTRREMEATMTNVPYNILTDTIAVFFNGKMYQVPRSDERFEPLRDHLKSGSHDFDILEDILDVPSKVARVSAGLVEVSETGVTYKNEPVHGVLVDKLLSLLNDGWDVTPWARFLDNLMKNPSYRSRNQLYGFLEKFDAPITEDGYFIAFKGVRMDYTDHHTGTIDNSIGQVVVMDRFEVDDDPNNTCSSGLHVCATEYLGGGMFAGDRIVVAKINPRDVVSIPTDYNFSKMRVCQYEVIDETTRYDMQHIAEFTVYR